MPTVCPIHSLDHCLRNVSPKTVCLPSLQEQGSALQALSQPRTLTFKTLGIKPHWLQELTNSFRKCSLRTFSCMFLSFATPCNHASSPPEYPQTSSPLNHISALPIFLDDVASSLPLVAEFVLSVFRLIFESLV